MVLNGDDLPQTVLAYARHNNVTQIVIGKTKDSRWRILLGRSLANALMQRTGGAALHFVSAGAPSEGVEAIELHALDFVEFVPFCKHHKSLLTQFGVRGKQVATHARPQLRPGLHFPV